MLKLFPFLRWGYTSAHFVKNDTFSEKTITYSQFYEEQLFFRHNCMNLFSLFCRITSLDSPYLTGRNETVLTSSYEKTRMEYQPGSFASTANTPLGRGLWAFITDGMILHATKVASDLGQPAVAGIEEALLDQFGEEVLPDRIKHNDRPHGASGNGARRL